MPRNFSRFPFVFKFKCFPNIFFESDTDFTIFYFVLRLVLLLLPLELEKAFDIKFFFN